MKVPRAVTDNSVYLDQPRVDVAEQCRARFYIEEQARRPGERLNVPGLSPGPMLGKTS